MPSDSALGAAQRGHTHLIWGVIWERHPLRVPWDQSLSLPISNTNDSCLWNLRKDHLCLQLRGESLTNVIAMEAGQDFWELRAVQVWKGFGATWDSLRCWNVMGFKVSSYPNHSVILWKPLERDVPVQMPWKLGNKKKTPNPTQRHQKTGNSISQRQMEKESSSQGRYPLFFWILMRNQH